MCTLIAFSFVVRISLQSGNLLTGTVPSDLPTSLWGFSLARNPGIVGKLPDSWQQLTFFDISGTSMQDPNGWFPTWVNMFVLERSTNYSDMSTCPTPKGSQMQLIYFNEFYDGFHTCSCANGYYDTDDDCKKCPPGKFWDSS
jgi:hypothetical protein